jgi:hypothetical protein
MFDSEGEVVATANVGRDITDFKKLEGSFIRRRNSKASAAWQAALLTISTIC